MGVEDFIVKYGKRVFHKIFSNFKNPRIRDSYFGKKILSEEQGNDHIAQLLRSNQPFMVARIGQAELAAVINYQEIQELKRLNPLKRLAAQIYGKDKYWNPISVREIGVNAGLFPVTEASLTQFAEVYSDSIKRTEALGVWYSYGEDLLFKKYCPEATLIPLVSIEPYYFKDPWSRNLRGKKVLVVHPFEKSIQQQHLIHQSLFSNVNVYPDFELKTIKAVQSLANNPMRFSSWFEALDYMKEEIDKVDFDIAIIGAGAYGLPLAAHVKDMGKQAIHMGGATQLFFGIRGARWEENALIRTFFNEHWVRPLPEEVPEKFRDVEKGCYW